MRGLPRIRTLLNSLPTKGNPQWITIRIPNSSIWTTIRHTSHSPLALDKHKVEVVCPNYPPYRQSSTQFLQKQFSVFNKTCDGQKRDERHEEFGAEDKRHSIAIVSATAGLLLIIWAKSQLTRVEAAKPIFNNDNEQYRGDMGKYDDQVKKKGAKKSNRERFNFIQEVVEKVKDTVVSIEVKDHSYVDFFTGVPHTASNGSGFIISDEGLIITNAHVISSCPRRPSKSLSVRLADGRTFAATIEDIDLESDLATIRIHAKNLPVLPLGCSSDTKIGEWVVAVGAPLTLTNTITAGVVSATGRGASELGIRSNDINYIQTDAAITFGNSGGPLINLDGEAIGINSMKVTSGISFAIPIDRAKQFLARWEARKSSGGKKPSRRYMGLTILTVTDQIKRELEARGYKKVSQGVLVWQVVVGSPAYLAGISPGDIIVRINGTEIASSADLYEITKSSDKLHVHVQRADKVYACILTPEHVTDDDDTA